MNKLLARTKIIFLSAPARGAMIIATLTGLSAALVPALTSEWAVRVTAWTATAVAGITVVVGVVARVTPILFPEEKGVLPFQPYNFSYGKHDIKSAYPDIPDIEETATPTEETPLDRPTPEA